VNIEVGLRGEATVVVGPNDTARAMRSGSVDALATPRVIALCEEAAVAAVEDRVPDGYTTVGMRVQVDHLQPSGLGTAVVAEATLEKVEGRRLTFTVSASHQCGLVAAGKVTRVLVDLEKFNSKVR
jgi:predicted thioesterase